MDHEILTPTDLTHSQFSSPHHSGHHGLYQLGNWACGQWDPREEARTLWGKAQAKALG